ncbi:MAG: DUF4432 family protein [Ilumatobacteraceae bacterium]|nr:DUF4432 family protein [Ilumatobacteraceae bacterium]
MITLHAGALTATIDESMGGELRQIELDGTPLLAEYEWDSPVAASRSRSYGDQRLDWLSEYRGGWQFLVPNAGAACVVDGVPLPFHGEWSRTAVDIDTVSQSEVSMRAGTRLPFVAHRTIALVDAPDRVRITTTIENVSGERQPFVWGEHPAFVAGPGDRIDLPAGPVVDRDDETASSVAWPCRRQGQIGLDVVPDTRPLESVHYLPDRPDGWAALRCPAVGVAIVWEIEDFPHMWLWRELGSPGFPFHGRTSLVALEPASSWPGDGLAAAIERGQAHWLIPGEHRTTTVTVIPFRPDGRAVTGADHTGAISFKNAATG